MRKFSALQLLFICISLPCFSQITVIGHNQINNNPVKNTRLTVMADGVVTKTLDTKNSADFKLQFDFGKVYRIYCQNAQSPVMYFELYAANVPLDKQDYRMTYEMNVPFVFRNDPDVDTTVFKDAFHRIRFDGKNRMVDDAEYNKRFAKSVIRKETKPAAVQPTVQAAAVTQTTNEEPAETIKPDQPSILAGKIMLDAGAGLPVTNRSISAIDKEGKVLKSTYTNRHGAFSFSGLKSAMVSGIRLDLKESNPGASSFKLLNSKSSHVSTARSQSTTCVWNLKPEELHKLIDNNFTTNIGGKLVSSSPKEKKFFANKNVYLSNKMNTVLQETKTNILGTFAFEDIKPDQQYIIGIDKKDIAPGEKVDLLSKEDNYIATLDSLAGGRNSMKVNSNYNPVFNEMSIGEDEMKMDVKATIFGDNVNHPIGKLKIVLLNDNYEVIDSALTDNLGTFKFKYLPFLKRFYLSAENTDNILDVFKNILIYSSDDNLIKIMTHQKGTKFSYKPVSAELSRLRELELDDPWLELIDRKDAPAAGAKTKPSTANKSISENILFEFNKYNITPQSKEILDKIILVLNTNKSLRIEVGAHTDSKGNEAANLKLSDMRAKTVRDYITATGIDKQRILAKGYGESKLLNNCGDNKPCSEMEHAQNRRIEFKILEE